MSEAFANIKGNLSVSATTTAGSFPGHDHRIYRHFLPGDQRQFGGWRRGVHRRWIGNRRDPDHYFRTFDRHFPASFRDPDRGKGIG